MGDSWGIWWLNVGALQWVSLLIKRILYSDFYGHFIPMKRPGILTFAFPLDVTPSKIMNFYSSKLTTNWKSQYY